MMNWLEEPTRSAATRVTDWSWTPLGDIDSIDDAWSSGRPTNTNSSTYNNETDDHGDSDRPNEGMI